ncbi:MAG: hypothetical protein CMJ94_10705 [Planctomycetes bacterium]|nr:hypothetical protein [Planctomycetota bacterium]
MLHWRRSFGLLCASVLLAASALAQDGPSAVTGEKQALEFGREAMADGDHEAAVGHFLFALARTDRPEEVLELLVENAAGDPDALALWAIDLANARIDANGRLKMPRALRGVIGEDGSLGEWAGWPERLARTRALAVRGLLKEIERKAKGRRPGSKVEQEWLEDFARAIAAPSPELLAQLEAHGPQIESSRQEWREVMDAMRKQGNSLISRGQWTEAVRMGRALRGLVAQAGFGDELQGPPAPSMDREASAVGDILGRARAALARVNELVFTLDELESMSPVQQRELTVDRASFGRPAVTHSPRDWYRVETSCGWETLYGSATTVEYHHQRLANFFGRDPFVDPQGNLRQQGILRVVPEAYGLEAEGSPHWWAGGFQGGNVTTLQFTMSTIPGLGRGITHELTHRFDGAIYPGLPGWLVEGKASWTAGAYGSMKEENFVPNHCSYGTQAGTLRLGYDEADKLREIVAGTQEEYRDNYTAGYSLYVYLNTWIGSEDVDGEEFGEEGSWPPPAEGEAQRERAPLYHDALQKFMEERKRLRNDPVKVFEAYFCDGENGRPADFDEFSERFTRWLRGFNNQEPAAWRDRYTQSVPGSDPGEVVRDEPTWTWLRRRAEPWFGQEHARMAGDLFADLGKHAEAVDAYTWALSVDELAPATIDRFAEELDAAKNEDAAWMVRHWPRLRPTRLPPALRTWEKDKVDAQEAARAPAEAGEAAPFVRDLGAVQALLAALQEASEAAAAAGHELSATALAADHNELAAWLGLPPLTEPRREVVRLQEGEIDRGVAPAWSEAQRLGSSASKLHPFSPPWRLMRDFGWSEYPLNGKEDSLVEGLWYEDETRALHVGRRKPRVGTGELDRTSHRRDAVVFADHWFEAGRYAVQMQIEPTTALLEGGLVVGWTRRDRQVRMGLSMGDWQYATGREEQVQIEGVRWSLDALYARQGAKNGSHSIPGDRRFFELTIEVDGPTADIWLDGKHHGTISTLDGSAIHGRIGWYTSTGAMKVSLPRWRRLDRSAHVPGARATGNGLHPQRSGDEKWRWMVDRAVTGLPLAPSGTILLWYPEQTQAKREELSPEDWYDEIADELNRLLDALDAEAASQGLLVLVPPSFPESQMALLREDFGPYLKDGFDVLVHARPEPLEEETRTIQGWRRPLYGFVDPTGFLRYAKRQGRPSTRLAADLRALLVLHQDHSRPGRAGAGD